MARKRQDKVVVAKPLGEDLVGSIQIGLSWAKRDNYGYEPVAIRLHPLDCALSKWPYSWPPVVQDAGVARHVAYIDMCRKGHGDQLQLL